MVNNINKRNNMKPLLW